MTKQELMGLVLGAFRIESGNTLERKSIAASSAKVAGQVATGNPKKREVAAIVATRETKKETVAEPLPEQAAGWSQVAPAKKDGAEVNAIINAVDPKKEQVAGMVAGGHYKKARAAETRPDEVAGAVVPRYTKKDGTEVAPKVAGGNPKKSETGQSAAVSNFVHPVVDDPELSEVEEFRLFSPAEPPLIAQDMPDYPAFCVGYPHGCIHCPHYIHTRTGLFCSMWETIYPGAVRWYPMQDEPAYL